MSPADLPAPVRDLIERRSDARARRDFAAADTIRDELAALGWQVEDTATGSTARPIPPSDPGAAPPDLLDGPAGLPVSIVVVAEDHREDLERLLRGLVDHPPPVEWELVVVANAPIFDARAVLHGLDAPLRSPTVVDTVGRLGWADARTLGLRATRGETIVLLDTSVEPTGDLTTPILETFDDPTVGLAGGWGVVSSDVHQFEAAPPGEVDAIEAYCLAVRRAALRAVGGFDRRFRYYRNADLDFSFAVRDAGWRAVALPLPLERHEHRGWTALPDDERERLSRRNFYRFLDRWRGRTDLLTGVDR